MFSVFKDSRFARRSLCCVCLVLGLPTGAVQASEAWRGDLSPIEASEWSPRLARHLLARTGFGVLPAEWRRAAAMTPEQAVDARLAFDASTDVGPAFEPSGAFDAGLDPFFPSRPAATDHAKAHGHALGVEAKPSGNRRLQQVADRYLYWKRASDLETKRLAYWWANRMLLSPHPLQEKLTLFWHGHFATSEEKVIDYRKLWQQNRMLRAHAAGDFRPLLLAVARDPAMLKYLDAAFNVKGQLNENFAREIMELFTMGTGHYSEQDIREAARAFTGWRAQGLDFVFSTAHHDAGQKHFLGHEGPWGGEDIIDLILAQDATAEFIASKLYVHFVRAAPAPALRQALGALWRAKGGNTAAFLRSLLLSKDFYSEASQRTRIQSPVELMVSTYRLMGLRQVPTLPDFNDTAQRLGQALFFPPNVAGWPSGMEWITPGLLTARANWVYDLVFPPIDHVATDRVPDARYQIVPVGRLLAEGKNVTVATMGEGAEPQYVGDRQELFNTRLASYRAWRKAIEMVKPIARAPARLDLSTWVLAEGCQTVGDAVDLMAAHYLGEPLAPELRQAMADVLQQDLGTEALAPAATYMEEALRNLLHMVLSQPAHQLG